MHDIDKLFGIGPKLLEELHRKNIYTIEELLASNIKLPKIVETAALIFPYETRVTRKRAELEIMNFPEVPGIEVIVTGSFRRGSDDMKDLDVLLISDDINALDTFTDLLLDSDRYVFAMRGRVKAMLWSIIDSEAIRMDVFLTSEKSKWASLVHYTGSVKSNINLRVNAMRKGLKINEKSIESLSTGEIYYPVSERDVFERSGVEYLEPKDR